MGKTLVIKGADFSAVAVTGDIPAVVPIVTPTWENVALVQLTPTTGYYILNDATEGVTNFDQMNVRNSPQFTRWMNEIDVGSYNYKFEDFTQTQGTAGVLNVWILDENRIVIKKATTSNIDGVLTVAGMSVDATNYPQAKYIGFGTNILSTTPPVLKRCAK